MTTSFLSVRDYFSYYIAGVAWLVLFASAFVHEDQLRLFRALEDGFGTPLMTVLAVLVPYVLGFSLSGLGLGATRLLLKVVGDPQWLVVDPKDSKHQGATHWLSYKAIGAETIGLVAKNLKLGTQTGHKASVTHRFNLIKTYVGNSGLPSAAQAFRNRTLANLAESLLIPVPASFLILAVRLPFAKSLHPDWYLEAFLWYAAIGSGLLLCRQYLYSREYEAKHLYWTFAASGAELVRAANEGQARGVGSARGEKPTASESSQ